MIRRINWTARTFDHELPVGLFPVVLERLRGTPMRAADLLTSAAEPRRRQHAAGSWSAQEHVGHLDDLHELDMRRLDDYLSGASQLTAADMSNRATNEANHNATPTHVLLERLCTRRAELIRRLERVTDLDAARSALHPRLRRPLRLVDWMFFVAEHDDHHLTSARECLRAVADVNPEPAASPGVTR